MSAPERAADFMRVFPAKKLSTTRLLNIYKKHKVRKKKVVITKLVNETQRKRIKRQVSAVRDELKWQSRRGFRIIYLDEMMITKSTIPKREWSKKYQNV